MTDDVIKIFDMLGLEPGDRFMIEGSTSKIIYTIDEYEISNIERELKALEIIKKCRIKVEKREDFDVVGYATFRKNGKYRYYINDIEITQEEYELLKEVFCNE